MPSRGEIVWRGLRPPPRSWPMVRSKQRQASQIMTARSANSSPRCGACWGRARMLSRWYRTGVIYSLDIGLFQDANGDGIGDVQGLTLGLRTTAWCSTPRGTGQPGPVVNASAASILPFTGARPRAIDPWVARVMKAQVGDQLIIESAEPGMPGGAGTIVAARNADGSPPYLAHCVTGDFESQIEPGPERGSSGVPARQP